MIALILAFAAGLFIREISKLVFSMLLEWFEDREELLEEDCDTLAFTLQNRLENGCYATVQGIFDVGADEVVEARNLKSEYVDETIEDLHYDQELAIYE